MSVSLEDWSSFVLSNATAHNNNETPPFVPPIRNNNTDLYALDTAISDEASFAMFALYERHKDVPMVQQLYKQLQSVKRSSDAEKQGYKNRMMVVLQGLEIQRLQKDLQEQTILARELGVFRGIVEKITPLLEENERLKQVCTDLVRLAEEKDKQNSELIANRDRHFEEYEALKKRSKIAVQEEVNAEHAKAIACIKLFLANKVTENDLVDCLVVFLEKTRLMNRLLL